MTAAMISTDMPTSGTVIFPVRKRASVSCSDASAERNVAHFAASDRPTGAPAVAPSAADAAICCSSTSCRSSPSWASADTSERFDASATRMRWRSSTNSRPSPVRAAWRSAPSLPTLAGEQHRHHVEVGRQLVAQIATDLRGATTHVEVDDQRGDGGGEHGETDRRDDPERHDADGLADPEEERWREQPHHGRGDEHRRVRFGRALHETEVGEHVAAERMTAVHQPPGADPAGHRSRLARAVGRALEVGDEPWQCRAALGEAGEHQPHPGHTDQRRGDQTTHGCHVGASSVRKRLGRGKRDSRLTRTSSNA